jgi:surface protein
MFNDAKAFNQDIGNWNTAKVWTMQEMFRDATSFNRDLSIWCVERITTHPPFFDLGADAWVLPRPVWGTCPE